jgi:hypothetical protein
MHSVIGWSKQRAFSGHIRTRILSSSRAKQIPELWLPIVCSSSVFPYRIWTLALGRRGARVYLGRSKLFLLFRGNGWRQKSSRDRLTRTLGLFVRTFSFFVPQSALGDDPSDLGMGHALGNACSGVWLRTCPFVGSDLLYHRERNNRSAVFSEQGTRKVTLLP